MSSKAVVISLVASATAVVALLLTDLIYSGPSRFEKVGAVSIATKVRPSPKSPSSELRSSDSFVPPDRFARRRYKFLSPDFAVVLFTQPNDQQSSCIAHEIVHYDTLREWVERNGSRPLPNSSVILYPPRVAGEIHEAFKIFEIAISREVPVNPDLILDALMTLSAGDLTVARDKLDLVRFDTFNRVVLSEGPDLDLYGDLEYVLDTVREIQTGNCGE